MVFAYFDRVKETTTTTGLGDITLGGAQAGFQPFSARYANGDTFHYTISAGAGGWEVGLGTWLTGNVLRRTKVFASSNSDSAVDFAAGSKEVFVTLPASAILGPTVEIDVTASPWNIRADGTDETVKMKAVFDYLWSLNAAGLGAMMLLPPRVIRVTEYLRGISNAPQGCGVPLIPYVSIRGCGSWLSGFRVGGTTPIHGMLGSAPLNAGGGFYANYRDFYIQNDTCTWRYGGIQRWAPSTDYSSTPVGTYVRPVKPSNVLLKLTSTRGTSGAYRPIGELYTISAQARMLGSAAYGHATVCRVTDVPGGALPGLFGVVGAGGHQTRFQVSTDGGNTWGSTVTPADGDFVVIDLSTYVGMDGSTQLGAGVGAKIANNNWTAQITTTTNGAFTQPGSVGGTVTIPLTSTNGLAQYSIITVAGSGLYEVQTVTAGVSVLAKLWVAYPSGTGGTGRAVGQVYAVQPRVEVISYPTAADQMMDLEGFTGGPLGVRNFANYRVSTPGTLDPSIYTTALLTATPGAVGGTVNSAYTDVTYGGMTLRVHGGVQQSVPDIAYQTPIFGWSVESTRRQTSSNPAVQGTFIRDNSPGLGNVWEVVEAPDAIRLDGAGFCGFHDVTTIGGNCGYAISQSENVQIDGNFYCSAWSLAAFYVSNSELRFGEGGQFANAITIAPTASLYGEGYGIVHSGGLGFTYGGCTNFQQCEAGWCYLAGLYGASINAGYVETAGGGMYNSAYLTRYGAVQPVQSLQLTTGFAGSAGGNYFLYCYSARFNFDGVMVGGALAGFGGIATCNVTGTGAKFGGGYLVDAAPSCGHVTDYGNAITWKGYTTETQRNLALSGWGNSNIDVVPGSSDVSVIGGPSAHGWTLHSLVPLSSAQREGQKFRLTNFSGFFGLIKHNSGSAGAAAYKIFTETGDDLLLPGGGSIYSYVELEYWGQSGSIGWYVRNHTPTDQRGTATLVSGVVTITAALRGTSQILVALKTPSGTTSTVEYAALGADRTNGVLGSFKVTALLAAGTINTSDNSTLDWLVKY